MLNTKRTDKKDAFKQDKPPKDAVIINLAIAKDAPKILKCYKRMNNTIKNLFTHEGNFVKLEKPLGNPRKLTDAKLGTEIHATIHNCVAKKEISEEDKKGVQALLKALKSMFPTFEIHESEYSLKGYMTSKENPQHSYYWSGSADAIAKYKGHWVIVDWKVVDLLDLWEHAQTYSKYFFQCLAYARLLQLQWNLDELPYILIVPISSTTRDDIHPGLFTKYTAECIKKLNEYEWSETEPNESNVQKEEIIQVSCGNLFKDEYIGEVNLNQKLESMLCPDATIGDLLEAFDMPRFKLVENKNQQQKQQPHQATTKKSKRK